MLLLADGKTLEEIKLRVDKEGVDEYSSLSWHSCAVDEVGLTVELIEEK